MVRFNIDIFGVFTVVKGVLGHVERLKLFITCTLASVDKIGDALLALIVVILVAAIDSDEFINGQEAATNPNHDCLTFDLHEDLLSCESVNSWSLSLEVHLTAETKRGFVDVIGQVLVNWIVFHGLVDEQFVLHTVLGILTIDLKAMNKLILSLAPFQELN